MGKVREMGENAMYDVRNVQCTMYEDGETDGELCQKNTDYKIWSREYNKTETPANLSWLCLIIDCQVNQHTFDYTQRLTMTVSQDNFVWVQHPFPFLLYLPGSNVQRGPTQTPLRHLIRQIRFFSSPRTPTTPTNCISWIVPTPEGGECPPFTVSKMSGEGDPFTRTSGDAHPTPFVSRSGEPILWCLCQVTFTWDSEKERWRRRINGLSVYMHDCVYLPEIRKTENLSLPSCMHVLWLCGSAKNKRECLLWHCFVTRQIAFEIGRQGKE